MKKLLSLTLTLFLTATLAVAQTAHETASEQKANELLKKASEKIKGYSSMEVDFSYVMENTDANIKETMNGKIFSKGDKYHMSVGDNIFISDGKNVWNFIEELYEIHINTIENTEGGLTPTALLSSFENEYKGKHIRQETQKGRMVDVIDLIPITPQSFFKYRLVLDATDQSLISTIAYDRHGGTYTYNIDNMKTNQNIPDSRFVFNRADFPANADLIDLR
jgi:outer membrane lipoprotein-sorting protein